VPGSPATSPRLAIPRIASTDTDDVPRDLNAAVDRIDAVAGRFESGPLASRPSTGAGIADRYYYATDALGPGGVVGVLYRDAGGATPTWTAVNPGTRPLVTSLPGSPADGQEVIYQADVAGTYGGPYNWPLRYRSAVSKWEPIAKPVELLSEVTAASVGSGAWTAPTGAAGPTISVPLAGDYGYDFGAGIAAAPVAGVLYQMGLGIGAANPVAPAIAQFQQQGTTSLLPISKGGKLTGLTAGIAVTCKYFTASGAPSFSNQFLRLWPIRLG
jgi:hypothetical protein